MSLLPRFPKVFSSWARQESFNDHIDTDLKTIESLITSSSAYYHTVTFTGAIDGTNKNFTLASPLLIDSEDIYLSRAYMQNDSNEDYTLSGVNLSFVTAPQVGDKIKIKGTY